MATSEPAAAFKHALLLAGERIREARDELCALDAAAGDGDLGATLATGFAHVETVLRESDSQDIGAMLSQAGAELAGKAPSTIGALLGTALLRAGKSLKGASELDGVGVAAMLESATSGVAERGRATPGQRTILDAMAPAAAAAAAVAERGGSPVEALEAARVGAADGAEETAAMEPQLGRAGWIRDRARGTKDAGAAAWAIFLAGLADGLRRDGGDADSEVLAKTSEAPLSRLGAEARSRRL